MNRLFSPALLFALGLLFPPSLRAGEPIPDIDVILEQNPGGTIVESATGGLDEISLDVGKDFAAALSANALRPGWTFETEGKSVRLAGPKVPVGQPVRFKLDAGDVPRPKKISYRVRLEGRTLLQRRNEKVELVPPRKVIGSLQGIVAMPTQVAPGEPMQMRVTDPAALPAGGTWSLAGVVVDDSGSDGADAESVVDEWQEEALLGSTRRVALGVPSGEEVPREALDDIAAILGMSTEGQGPWEVVALDAEASPGSAGVTLEEEEVYRVRQTGSGNDELASRIVTIARGGGWGEDGRSKRFVMFSEDEDEEEEEDGWDLGSHCFERLPPSGEGLVLKDAEDPGFAWWLFCTDEEGPAEDTAKRIRTRGDGEQGDDGVLTYDLQIAVIPSEGATTSFSGNHNSTRSNKKTPKTRIVAGANPDGTVLFDLPEDLEPGGELSLQYVDLYGDAVIDVPSVPGVEIVEPSASGAARITDATPRTLAGQQVCVCGSFPGPAAWNGLLLDGEALGSAVSASSRMAWVQFPTGLGAGEHVVTGAPGPGFPAGDRAVVLVVEIAGELDSSKLQRLETTPMRLWVIGTSEATDLRVRNKTPSIISIEGGADQVIRTSGGEPNMLERRVQGLSPGAFDIEYELAGAGCPCAASLTEY